MVDVAIVGAGPAGVSAALNAKLRDKSYLWFGSGLLSEKIRKAEKISNYPGLSGISGREFANRMQKQIEEMGIAMIKETVNQIFSMGDSFSLMVKDTMYEAKTVLLATGVMTGRVLPGEREFLGRGVSYCATCDGNLYRGKKLFVMSTSREMEGEVEYLADLAKEVSFVPYYKEPRIQRETLSICEKRPVEIMGGDKAEAVKFADGTTEDADGIFFLKDAVSPDILVPGIETERGHIVVNRRMETNIPGCYAAGDLTGRPYQYTKAVGEGNVAMHSILEYLSDNK